MSCRHVSTLSAMHLVLCDSQPDDCSEKEPILAPSITAHRSIESPSIEIRTIDDDPSVMLDGLKNYVDESCTLVNADQLQCRIGLKSGGQLNALLHCYMFL